MDIDWSFGLPIDVQTRCRRANLSPQPPPLEGRGSTLICEFHPLSNSRQAGSPFPRGGGLGEVCAPAPSLNVDRQAK